MKAIVNTYRCPKTHKQFYSLERYTRSGIVTSGVMHKQALKVLLKDHKIAEFSVKRLTHKGDLCSNLKTIDNVEMI